MDTDANLALVSGSSHQWDAVSTAIGHSTGERGNPQTQARVVRRTKDLDPQGIANILNALWKFNLCKKSVIDCLAARGGRHGKGLQFAGNRQHFERAVELQQIITTRRVARLAEVAVKAKAIQYLESAVEIQPLRHGYGTTKPGHQGLNGQQKKSTRQLHQYIPFLTMDPDTILTLVSDSNHQRQRCHCYLI